MKRGQFIWADLSTYDTKKSIAFYQAVFGWEMMRVEDYFLAKFYDSYIAAIFETPSYLKKINMPHFWMSYFQVDSVSKAVEVANQYEAKVEVETAFYDGRMALIRDPQGAGFTVYDGAKLNFTQLGKSNSFLQTELHVSEIESIIPFYTALFDWDLKETNIDTYENSNGIVIRKIDNAIKGKYEYWVTTILVDNLEKKTQCILDNDGFLIAKEAGRNLMSDNSNEAFFYIQE